MYIFLTAGAGYVPWSGEHYYIPAYVPLFSQDYNILL